LYEANEVRKASGLLELSWGQWSEIRAFDRTTKNLALTLRELAKGIRLGSDPCFDHGDEEKFARSQEATSLIPLYVDLAFVYVRRLADHFARASRYVLFKRPGSAPIEYKNLRHFIAEPTKLRRLEPLCGANLLQEAFERYSGWFDKLRDSTDENGELKKGIRDIMEHHPIAVTVYHSQVADGPWEVTADLGEPGINASFRPDLIPTLQEIIADMACLWTMVCDSSGLTTASQPWVVPYGDALPMAGNDDDATAFWPESTA
jgi:hypothetical protein